MLTEYVRIALRRHILRRLNPEGKPLPILRIGEGIENLVRESIRQTAMGTYTALSSRHKTQILQLIEQALKQSAKLFIVTSVDTRRFLRKNYRSHLVRRTDFVMAGIRRGEPYTSGRKY